MISRAPSIRTIRWVLLHKDPSLRDFLDITRVNFHLNVFSDIQGLCRQLTGNERRKFLQFFAFGFEYGARNAHQPATGHRAKLPQNHSNLAAKATKTTQKRLNGKNTFQPIRIN